jgi:hypothetical protein
LTSIIREVLISVLKATKEGPVSHELVQREAKIPEAATCSLLQTLKDEGLIYFAGGSVAANAQQRVSLAIRALKLGTDYESVSRLLSWKEFENLTAVSLESLDYEISSNLRFSHDGRRWELDILGCLRPLAVCIDCKQWRRGSQVSKLKKAAEKQVERTVAFCDSLPNPRIKVQCSTWEETRFVPVLVSLAPSNLKFHNGTPIVPILQLRDFLAQLPMCLDQVRSFNKRNLRLKTAS